MDHITASELTAKRLETILTAIDSKDLRENLFNRFFLENPLDLAKLLHALALPDSVKSQILALKVGMPPNHKETDLSILVDRAMQKVWDRLSEGSI